MRYKLSLIIFFAALLLQGCDMVRGGLGLPTSEQLAQMKVQMDKHQKDLATRDSLAAVQQAQIQKLTDSLNKLETPLSVSTLDKKFYLIVGTFKEESNIVHMVEFAKKKGFAPVRIPLKKGVTMVAIDGYNTLQAAIAKVAEIKGTEICPYDVWVYSVSQRLHVE